MKRMLALVLALMLLAASAMAEERVLIFHTNDLHGAAMEAQDREGTVTNVGFARFKAFIDSQGAENVLVLDAGDALHGLAFATVTGGESMARLMVAVGYDAMAAGNHDFDYGVDWLETLKETQGLPVMAANVLRDGEAVFPASELFTMGDGKVGVFALSTPETPQKTSQDNVAGLDFGDAASVITLAQATVDALRAEGANAVIALTHLGSEDWAPLTSVELAEQVTGIDLIIDGHSHSVLEDVQVNGVPIVSAGESFAQFGMVEMILADDGQVTVSARLVPASELTSVEPDAEILALTEQINAEFAPVMEEVVAHTAIELTGERELVRSQSTTLGRAICEAMRLETGADVAIINGGSIRATVPAGDITRGQLISVMPFGNYACVVSATGAELSEALHNALIVGTGSFPQFAGMVVEAMPVEEQTAEGVAYTRYEVTSITVGGEPLEDERSYQIAINDYMYESADEYAPIAEGRTVMEFGVVDEILVERMMSEGAEALSGESNLIIAE